jgi:hypothetical protein
LGSSVSGMDEWLRDLRTLPERAPKAFRGVMSRAGVQIKLDWKRRWSEVTHPQGHIPHLIRGIGYDLSETTTRFRVTVGVASNNRQAFLSKILEYGTLTSAPHPAGQLSLDAEVPKMEKAVGQVAEDLLNGAKS